MSQGLVHVYTGEGKGKTTASLGLAFRAVGYEKRVKLIRFLKGGFSGELKTISLLSDWIDVEQINPYDKRVFGLKKDEQNHLKELTKETVARLMISLEKGEYDLYILDEIFGALKREQVTIEDIKNLINKKADRVELVLTGRNAPLEIRELADYVTVMTKEAHPIDQKIKARVGIEY